MEIDEDSRVFFQKSVASEPLGVNAIVLGQVTSQMKKSLAQLATGTEVMTRQFPKVFKGAREETNVVLRSDQFLKNVLF